MSWQQPTEQQLREVLGSEAADLTESERRTLARVLARCGRGRVVRWSELDREFARRALARQKREPNQ